MKISEDSFKQATPGTWAFKVCVCLYMIFVQQRCKNVFLPTQRIENYLRGIAMVDKTAAFIGNEMSLVDLNNSGVSPTDILGILENH